MSPPFVHSLGCYLHVAGQAKCCNLMNTDTARREKGLWLNCCSPFPVCVTQCKRHRVRGSSINAGGLHPSPRLTGEVLSGQKDWWEWVGCSAAVCLYREVARNLETPSFSSSISPSLWALKDYLAFVGCGEISQKHFPSLKREKARASKSCWTWTTPT